ncbi:MAG: glutathione S-transferase family protein [Cognatishimia sp.]|uniref:glutathione S-transferase family protein n=1 Tax=Cognatishimia sp. TaxID=2211648 RepID=UPI003B8ADE49
MQKPYRLHYAPDNASLIVRLVLLELDVPFDSVLVDRGKSEQASDHYLAINPAGLIPALETDHGTLFETGAILLWLSERHSAMAPGVGSPERADFLKYLFYVSNTLHPNLRMHFYPQKYITADQSRALREGCRSNLIRSLDMLNTAAAGHFPWLNGADLSVLDIYLAACLRWMALYANQAPAWFDLNTWPNLRALCAQMDQRDSVATASPIEGFAPNPFTSPLPVTPTIGTAI